MSVTDTLSSDNYRHLTSIEEGYFWFEGRILWIKSLISRYFDRSQVSTLSLADLGCGTGQVAKILNDEFSFKKVVLVDGHSYPIASWKDSQVCRLKQNLEEDLHFEEKVDLITCLDVLEHLKNDENFLKNVRKQLSQNGKLLLTVPAFSFLFSDWDKQWGHFRRYRIRDLKKTLQESGFSIEFSSYAWSFLLPAALLRLLSKHSHQEFPSVSKFVNGCLLTACRVEIALSRWFRIPLGTSVIVVAKPRCSEL